MALAAKKPTLLNSLSSSPYEEKVAQPEIDGSRDLKCKDSRAFLAIFASRLPASSKLREFFPLCLLSERRESKSSPGDISLVMRPFKIPEERKGREEQEDQRREEKGCQGREESLTTPSPRWPSQPRPACRLSHGALSPVARGQYLQHLLSNILYMKEEKEEDCKGEF